jgi:hypothetical protein
MKKRSAGPFRIPHSALLIGVAAWALLAPACSSDGHFTVLGYSTRPNFDLSFKTVRVPIFKNRTFWSVTPAPGLEMDLTQAVVRAIEARSPYKVTQGDADTELTGTIVTFTKGLLNYTQQNEVREAETTLVVEIRWRNLRTGKWLTRPPRRGLEERPLDDRAPILAVPDTPLVRPVPIPATPQLPTTGLSAAELEDPDFDPARARKPPPVTIRSVAHFRPELGESITTAMQKNINRMARQIVNAMEKPW